jgi:hypothetical protein
MRGGSGKAKPLEEIEEIVAQVKMVVLPYAFALAIAWR